jgi:hypothetical protein
MKSDTLQCGNGVVTGREKYQREALAVIRAAEMLRDPAERVHLLEIARRYLTLAKHIRDRRDDGTAHRDEARPEGRPTDG